VPNLPSPHPEHDQILIARLAAADLASTDRDAAQAQALLTDCPDCAELYADLQAIASATAALAAPRRTRDFRLTDADAARLRPSGWRGALARLGSPSFAFTRPLAAGLATLGIAGLLLASLPAALLGSAASSSEHILSTVGNSVGGAGGGAYAASPGSSAAPAFGPEVSSPVTGTDAGGPSAAPSAAASAAAPSAVAPAPATDSSGGSTTGGTKSGVGLDASRAPQDGGATGTPPKAVPEPGAEGGAGPSPLVVLSLVLLAAGLGLGSLRLIARRVA
jgi:hypothetical protein